MKKIFTLIFCIPIITLGQLNFNGHQPSTTIPYNASPYGYNPKMNQLAGSATASNKIFNGYASDQFVNFTYDTGGKSVYIVYTTNGSNPNKTNGTAVGCSFSTYTNPDRLWGCQIPASANTTGANIKYTFYISNGSLADGYARVDGQGGNQYLTTWDESSVQPFQYTVLDNALPVSLISFTANAENTIVNLNWETAEETNNDYFEIQRSINTKSFETIGTLKGQLNTSQQTTYRFTDLQATEGVNYYRLRQVDLDGSFNLSRIISVNIENGQQENFVLMPNPTSDKLLISQLRKGSLVEVLDMDGTQLKQYTASGLNLLIETKEVKSGMKLIRVVHPDGYSSTKKLMIRH